MSGLGKIGGLPGFVQAGDQVSARDIDRYEVVTLTNPSTSSSWYAAGTSTGTATAALVLSNAYADWPRNPYYNFTGGTAGGTIKANFIDQFGQSVSETVTFGSAAAGGSVYGTAIVAKFVSGTVYPNTSTQGTYTIGFGTASNGSAASNWFGLLTKIGGTSDVKTITWINNGTPTTLNAGTAIGTLVDLGRSAFQGTAGVTLTDRYRVIFKPTFDNASSGTMCAL